MRDDIWDKPVYGSEGKLLANSFSDYQKAVGPGFIDWSNNKMKNEKHVALAKKTIEYWQDTHSFKIPADIKHDMLLDFSEALSQVESEALASKVVFPTDAAIETASMRDFGNKRKDNKEKYCTNNDFYMAVTSAFERGAKWVLSRITLAPKEPEVKAQGFDEWELTELTIDDDTTRELCRIAYQAGQASQVRLPEKYTSQTLISGGYEHGYNAAIDDMRKLNGLENV